MNKFSLKDLKIKLTESGCLAISVISEKYSTTVLSLKEKQSILALIKQRYDIDQRLVLINDVPVRHQGGRIL